ncbi:MAG: hypothetical protein QNJ72_42030 [Pleurocapsa sp. MO_226.B13]|nr:hypothetical protein [Pleurocapsa sp. MO_226.B13]
MNIVCPVSQAEKITFCSEKFGKNVRKVQVDSKLLPQNPHLIAKLLTIYREASFNLAQRRSRRLGGNSRQLRLLQKTSLTIRLALTEA